MIRTSVFGHFSCFEDVSLELKSAFNRIFCHKSHAGFVEDVIFIAMFHDVL